jgi:hypothetical protein
MPGAFPPAALSRQLGPFGGSAFFLFFTQHPIFMNLVINFPANIQVIDAVCAPAPGKGFYYVISLTGTGQQVYTLYQLGSDGTPKLGTNHDSGYRGNLGTTLETAIETAIAYLANFSNCLLVIEEGQTNLITRGNLLGFGKYAHLSIAEIHATNPSFITWLCKEFREATPWTCKKAAWVKAQLAEIDREILDARIAANRAASTSEYVGKIGERKVWALLCCDVKTYKGQDGEADSYLAKFEDDNGSCFCAYADKKDTYEVLVKYSLKGTVAAHKEYMGIKTTRINRVVKF